MRRRLLLYLAALAIGYCVLVLFLWWQQDRLVFPGAGLGDRPIDSVGVDVLQLARPGGETFRVAVCRPAAPRAVLLFFVGNGEDLRSGARQAAELAAYGVLVLVPEYPGYGKSPGRPGTESILEVADAAAVHGRRLAVELGVPFLTGGSSLGTFCAVRVCAAHGAERCLLRAPPTSLAAAAAVRFWWLPIGLLLRHRFDNEASAPLVRCPVLVVHGDRDAIVPLAQGQRLRGLFGGPAELVVVAGAGHNDLSLAVDGPVGARIGEFLRAP